MRITSLVRQIRAHAMRGDSYYCPICDLGYRRFLRAGETSRPNALCPGCGALERHRLLIAVLEQLWKRAELVECGRLLHVAPEAAITAALEQRFSIVSVDRQPSRGMVAMDLTNLAFPDSIFDAIICLHVLEHVDDDRAALSELWRVMKPGGWGVIQVPMIGDSTHEYPSIVNAEERQRLYGQADHVRQYGRDFVGRLKAAQFLVTTIAKTELFQSVSLARLSVDCEQEVIIAKRPAL